MTAPAITVGQDRSVVFAAGLMDRHGVKRLPVVDDTGRLVGIVSRRDVLRVFARPDDQIERELRHDMIQWAEQVETRVAVKDGIVTLEGHFDQRSKAVPAVQLSRAADGVVDVLDKTSWDIDDTRAKHIGGI